MPKVDKLDARGRPLIDLPEDWGDGPFLSSWDRRSGGANFVETKEEFRLTEPFEDDYLTNLPFFGRADKILIGVFRVSETLRPRTFRRVSQTFRYQPSRDLKGTFEIQFRGGGQAIFKERANALAGGIGPAASNAFTMAMDALTEGSLLAQLTLPAQASTYQIRLRMPGYVPGKTGKF